MNDEDVIIFDKFFLFKVISLIWFCYIVVILVRQGIETYKLRRLTGPSDRLDLLAKTIEKLKVHKRVAEHESMIGTYRSLSYVLANPVSLMLREQNWCLSNQLRVWNKVNTVHVEVILRDVESSEDASETLDEQNPLRKLNALIVDRKKEKSGKTRYMAYVGHIDTKTEVEHVWTKLAEIALLSDKKINVILQLLDNTTKPINDSTKSEVEKLNEREIKAVNDFNAKWNTRNIFFISYRENFDRIIIERYDDFLKRSQNLDKSKIYLLKNMGNMIQT